MNSRRRSGYIIRQQLAIEIFPDEHGDVVLRQGGNIITVRATNIGLLVEFLVAVANDDDSPIDDDDTIEATVPTPPTAPMTNAERQKRYRKNKRNAVTAKRNAVTNRNGKNNATVTARNENRNAKRNGVTEDIVTHDAESFSERERDEKI